MTLRTGKKNLSNNNNGRRKWEHIKNFKIEKPKNYVHFQIFSVTL